MRDFYIVILGNINCCGASEIVYCNVVAKNKSNYTVTVSSSKSRKITYLLFAAFYLFCSVTLCDLMEISDNSVIMIFCTLPRSL